MASVVIGLYCLGQTRPFPFVFVRRPDLSMVLGSLSSLLVDWAGLTVFFLTVMKRSSTCREVDATGLLDTVLLTGLRKDAVFVGDCVVSAWANGWSSLEINDHVNSASGSSPISSSTLVEDATGSDCRSSSDSVGLSLSLSCRTVYQCCFSD